MKRIVKYGVVPTALLVGILTSASSCDSSESAPKVQSQQAGTSWAGSPAAPIDKSVYTITGEVAGQVNSLTRETQPAHGSLNGPSCFGTSGCYGSTGGSFFGPVTEGKGFVRLLVSRVTPSTDLATPGMLDILKVVDTKATALQAGDIVTFKCLRQFEGVSAAVKNQKGFDPDTDGTWELDYCRMASSEIQVKPLQ